MTDTATTPYLRLAEARAPKLGARSTGGIGYALLADPERSELFLTLTANEGSGNFSKEVVPLRDIEEALAAVPEGEPFAARLLRSAFVGKSSCNAGFLAAALVHCGLLTPAAGAKHKLLRLGDWNAWKAAALARESAPSESVQPEGKARSRRSGKQSNEQAPVAEDAHEGDT